MDFIKLSAFLSLSLTLLIRYYEFAFTISQSTGKMDKGKNVGSSLTLTVPPLPPSTRSLRSSALVGTAVDLTRIYAIVLTVKCGIAGHTIATTFELLKTPNVTEYLEMLLAISNKDNGFSITH